ncbi:hypothetical protein Naga_100353g2 [Nannochloropsis gaditana]|uniref:Uncharacterized protein n=1 Tax=Nannochloropsis gaditana TaxID=72520 RepID=W7TNQ0_9STRA|nr:hypothetical protein Naga_100353g2 [Nannochloropsis gaditana]
MDVQLDGRILQRVRQLPACAAPGRSRRFPLDGRAYRPRRRHSLPDIDRLLCQGDQDKEGHMRPRAHHSHECPHSCAYALPSSH